MKQFYSFRNILILLSVLCLSTDAIAQPAIGKWINTGPIPFPINSSGQVNGLGRVSQLKFHASKKDKMYAVSASGGLYTTTDNGKSWTFTSGTETLPQTSCSAVCIDYTNDSTIYLSLGDADYYSNSYGIYKTTNAGATWSAVTTGIGTKMAVEILMDSNDNKTLVAATSSGIWKTTDAGANWTQTRVGGSFRDMHARPLSKKTLYAATSTEFFVSNDFGSTWTQITSGLSFPSGNTGLRIGVTKADTNIVYLATTRGNCVVYKSINGGTSFTTVYNSSTQCLVCYDANPSSGGQGNYNFDINVNPENKNELLVIAHNVWRSTDGGATWNKRTAWYDECHTDMHQIVWHPYYNKEVYNANDGGVWLSTDTTARTWIPRCDGIAACEIYQAAQSPISRDVLSIGTQDNGELYYNGDWRTNRGGDWTSKCAFDYATASTVYYLGNGQRRSLVPMTGEVSYNSPFTPTNNSAIEFVPSKTNVCFLGKDSLWRSDNINTSSPSWTRIFNATDRILEIASCRADSNIVYFVTNNSKVVRCDKALSGSPVFTTYTTPVSTAAAASIVTSSKDTNVVFLSCGAAIYRSANKGATWTNITGSGLSGLNIRKILHDDYSTNERLFVYAGNFLHSKNNSTTSWTNYTQNLPSVCSGKNLMLYNTGDAASVLRISTYGRGVWECGINNNLKPIVDFTSDKKVICVGDTVRYYKKVYGVASSVSWSFPGGTPSTSTADSPVVVYNTKGLYDASCSITGTAGTDTKTKTNYIEVSNRPSALLSEGFEGTTYPPAKWQLSSKSIGAWEQTDDASGFGTSTKCIIFDNNGINAEGKHDKIITPMMALKSTVSYAQLTFDVAYQPYSDAYPDSLLVTLSYDCGQTWNTIYSKSGSALATSPASAIYYRFTPSSSKWRKESIDLKPYAGNDILIAFENVGYYGQALFIDNVNISMSPAVDFEADDTVICAGKTVTFYDSTQNASSIDWSFPGGFPSTSSAKVVTITYPSPGNYTVTLIGTNALGTSSYTRTSYIKVLPNPVVTITAAGGVLTAACPTATAWQWYKNGVLIPGATANTFTPTSSGNYTVTVTDANGCGNTSPIYPFIPNSIGKTSFRNAGFELFPNPSKGRVILKANAVNGKEVSVYFYNVMGQQIASESITLINGGFVKEFDWSEFPKGIYEVRILTDGKNSISNKLVIE
ncbi:MAG: PKD domain-containing protein [Bacteroidota bacterium]